MAKSKKSATGSSTPRQMTTTPAGSYPTSMENLVDWRGHVSLNPRDYAPYTQDEVESFLASRPYEVHVVMTPDGRVIRMDSQWKSGQVSHNLVNDQISVRYDNPSSDGTDYIDMHFHPGEPDPNAIVYPIFSSQDIGSYAHSIAYKDALRIALPDRFAVKAYDGTRYELRFVGGGQRDVSNFRGAYTRAFNKARKEAWALRREHGMYDGFVRDEATARVDAWLKANAGKYGFEYTSNWTIEPLT